MPGENLIAAKTAEENQQAAVKRVAETHAQAIDNLVRARETASGFYDGIIARMMAVVVLEQELEKLLPDIWESKMILGRPLVDEEREESIIQSAREQCEAQGVPSEKVVETIMGIMEHNVGLQVDMTRSLQELEEQLPQQQRQESLF